MLLVPKSAGIAITREKNETPITALNGTRSLFTRRNSHQPGIPRSRENAYQVREALVRPAAPQKSCPTVAIRRTSFAAQGSKTLVKIAPTKPAPLSIAWTSVAAKRNAKSTNHPMTADQNTDRQT